MKSKLKQHYSFDSLAWVIASISTLTIAILIFLLFRLASNFYHAYLFSEFGELLSNGNFPQARQNMVRLFEQAPVVGRSPGTSRPAPRELKPLAEGILDLVSTLSTFDFATFDPQIRKLSAYKPIMRDYQGMLERWRTIEEISEKGKETAQKLKIMEEQYSKSLQDLKRVQDQYSLLSKDVSELFSLKISSESATDSLPPFYRSGVLANLPVLHGVPDGIQTLEELRDQLNALGGKVTVSGDNIQDAFRQKLSDLQDIGVSALDRFAELNKSITDLSIQIEDSKKLVESLEGRSKGLLKELIEFILNINRT